jgi:[ribosomal protein S5]-alanine N-acetyltransferase
MLDFNFSPFPNLQSQRLIYRQLTVADTAEIILLRGNPITMKFIPRPLINNHNDVIQFVAMMDEALQNKIGINWAVCTKDKPNEMIGIIGHYRIQAENHRAEIGYMFRQEHHGKGFASEAIAEITKYGFENMQLNSIEAVLSPDNKASEKVLLKNNYIKEGHFLEKEYYNGTFRDLMVYSLLSRNYHSNIDYKL